MQQELTNYHSAARVSVAHLQLFQLPPTEVSGVPHLEDSRGKSN